MSKFQPHSAFDTLMNHEYFHIILNNVFRHDLHQSVNQTKTPRATKWAHSAVIDAPQASSTRRRFSLRASVESVSTARDFARMRRLRHSGAGKSTVRENANGPETGPFASAEPIYG
jgi:hypothetical protein